MADEDIRDLWTWLREHERTENGHHQRVADQLEAMREDSNKRLTAIELTMSENKGGIKMLMKVGSIGVMLVTALAWVLTNVFHIGGVNGG